MTITARQALEDCRVALDSLVDGIKGGEWKRQWLLAIVLLRAVGHVLHKVDRKQSQAYRSAIDSWWSEMQMTKPEPAIFWQFIEEERNSTIKEYRTHAGQGVTIRVPTLHVNILTGAQWSDPSLPTLYHYTIVSGPFMGRDHREVLGEAIAWWEGELDAIDRVAAEA